MDGFQVVICGVAWRPSRVYSGSARRAAGLVRVSLIAPIDDFVYRPIAVREAVGVGWGRRYPVWDLTDHRAHGAVTEASGASALGVAAPRGMTITGHGARRITSMALLPTITRRIGP